MKDIITAIPNDQELERNDEFADGMPGATVCDVNERGCGTYWIPRREHRLEWFAWAEIGGAIAHVGPFLADEHELEQAIQRAENEGMIAID